MMKPLLSIILVVYFAFSAQVWKTLDKSDFAIPRWTEAKDSVLVKTLRVTDDEVVKMFKDAGLKPMTVKEARVKGEKWSPKEEVIPK